ncbi:MAG: trypsin-like peptidase domain-containing protein [Candidatus Acetothermia bacterium]
MQKSVVKYFVIALAVVLATASIPQPLAQAETEASPDSRETAITRVAESVGPAVARVEVTKTVQQRTSSIFDDPFFRYFFGEPPEEREREVESLGSGFVVNWEGQKYVLTNQHVIEDGDEIRLVFPDGETFKASVLAGDEIVDVAVLQIEEGLHGAKIEDLPEVELGDSDQAMVGEWVVAIGNPEGFQNTVTAGVLSAKGRDIPKPQGDGTYYDLLQTDAAVNPGNSGGPLVNTDGEVIGINTAIVRRSSQGVPLTGLNFAVGINSVKKVLPQLIGEGQVTRAWLGVWIQNLDAEMSEKLGVKPGTGALVTEVAEKSPAEAADIEAGDVITAVEGSLVENVSDLQQQIMYHQPGETVEIKLIRDGESRTVSATLETREGEEVTPQRQNQITSERYGITLQENSNQLAEEFDLVTDQGLVVIKVNSDGKAYGELQRGDVILEVENQKISTVGDWQEIIQSVGEDERVLLRVLRGGRYRYLML